MPAIGIITLADGQSTPVNKDFEPQVIDSNNVAHYVEDSGGIPIGNGRLSISLRPPVAKNGGSSKDDIYRAVLKFDLPTLEVTSPSTATGIQPAPTVAYTTIARMEFVIPARSTVQNRKDLLAFAKNLLAHAVATDVVVDLKSIY